jgi:hypothetical protein
LLQTFFQPLFSYTFPFNNFPAVLSPSVILFPSKNFPHQKAQSKRTKPKPKKPSKAKAKIKKQKPQPSFNAFYKQWQQGGAEALGREGLDIVTGETCVPASLNVNLGDAAVLLFSVSWPGLCLSWPTGKSN